MNLIKKGSLVPNRCVSKANDNQVNGCQPPSTFSKNKDEIYHFFIGFSWILGKVVPVQKTVTTNVIIRKIHGHDDCQEKYYIQTTLGKAVFHDF